MSPEDMSDIELTAYYRGLRRQILKTPRSDPGNDALIAEWARVCQEVGRRDRERKADDHEQMAQVRP